MQAVVGVVGIATDFVPVPGLKPAFGIIKFIWDNVQKASSNRDSLRNLATFCIEIFMAVNHVLTENEMSDHIHEVLKKFEEVLTEIQDFTKKHATVNLFMILLKSVDVGEKVVYFQSRLQNLSTAFNIAAYGDLRTQLGKILEEKHLSSKTKDENLPTESVVPSDKAENHKLNSPSSSTSTCATVAITTVQIGDPIGRLTFPSCDVPSTVPFLRAFHPSACDHFYTTDVTEMQQAVTHRGYVAEGTAGYLFTNRKDGTIPLFRSYNSGEINHFYTTDAKERDIATALLGYVNEGTVGYVYSTESCGTQPLFRLRSNWWRDHFYTMSPAEKDNAVANIGFMSENIAGYIFPPFPPVSALPPSSFYDSGGPHEVVYVGSAIFESSVHPCKIAPHLNHPVRVAYSGNEHEHLGQFHLLPINDQTMEWVLTSHGNIPSGRRPVDGGYEEDGTRLFHAIAYIDGMLVPGKTGEHLGAAYIPYSGERIVHENYQVLCWRF